MVRYPYPSESYVSTEDVGTKYTMNWLVQRLQIGKEVLFSTTLKPQDQLETLAVISVCFFTGARINEVLSIKWKDIMFDIDNETGNQWIRLQLKTQKKKQTNPPATRQIPIFASEDNPFYFIFVWLKDYIIYFNDQVDIGLESNQLKEQDIYNLPFFKTKSRAIYNRFTRYFKINPHGFRKILAQYLVVEKNMPLKTVQKIMGHSSLIPLDYYINLRTDDIKRDLLDAYKK